MKKSVILLSLTRMLFGCQDISSPKDSSPSPSTEKPTPSLSEGNHGTSSSSATEKISEEKLPSTVTVFSVNDIHGSLEPYSDPDSNAKELGIARLSYAIKHDEDYDPETSLILCGGDSWQGGYLAHEDKRLTDKLLSALGVDARAVGNHEFDAGLERVKELSEASSFPYLGLNVLDSEGNRPSFLEKSAVINKGPVRYGVIGVIDSEIESSVKEGRLGDYAFSSSMQLISDERNTLYSQGCDLVLLSAHADRNSSYIQTIGNTFLPSQLNGIFGGHSHSFQEAAIGTHAISYVQGGSNSKGYCKRTFSLSNKAVTRKSAVNASNKNYTLSDSVLEKSILDLLRKANQDFPIHDLAYFDSSFRRYKELNSFVPARMISYAKRQDLGEEKTGRKLIGIHNLGGIRSNIPKGTRTEKELFRFSPFDNAVRVSSSVSGSEILSSIGSDDNGKGNHATSYYCYRVENGSSIDKKETYDVVSIDYVFLGSYWKGSKPYVSIEKDGSPLFIRDRYKKEFIARGNEKFYASYYQ